ncbi:MAG: sodium:proton antiporter [Chloroflexi bacterium]|nr:sodium:proton antiporter [Chloroflexota bacterium]
MTEHLLLQIAEVVLLAVLAQWLAWRLGLPSILLLLLAGFVAGPLLGRVEPDLLLGELLFPIVSLAVAIILFEGGLSLKLGEIRETAHVVRNLVTLGALVTWVGSALAARWILDLELPVAALLGAVLVVTGPTVVLPLLRHVQPAARIASLLKWEGIVIDPVGAILAVLVFEAITAAGAGEATSALIQVIARTLFLGLAIGLAGAAATIVVIERDWLPDHLHTNLVLMLVIGGYAMSNALQHESGLATVTLMGIMLANQKRVELRHVVEFSERLQILFVPLLFVILAARLDPDLILSIEPRAWLFVPCLVLVVRPLAVAVSTLGSPLSWRERAFLAWMAPRGIVAAAVSSVFALELAHAGVAGADRLVSATFVVIVGTVALYGLTALPVARLLDVRQPDPQGLLILGAQPWAVEIGAALASRGIDVVMADLNRANCRAARAAGLRAYHGDLLSELAMEELDFSGLGYFLALTQNDEVNSLAVLHMQAVFGADRVYQLAPMRGGRAPDADLPERLRGRLLFGPQAGFRYLQARFASGARVLAHPVDADFDLEVHAAEHAGTAIPLFVLRPGGRLQVMASDQTLAPQPGDLLLSLADARSTGG